MATIHFCDDCGKEIKREGARIWLYDDFTKSLQMCYACFSKHWKPISKKFSLKKQNADKK